MVLILMVVEQQSVWCSNVLRRFALTLCILPHSSIVSISVDFWKAELYCLKALSVQMQGQDGGVAHELFQYLFVYILGCISRGVL